ncbi:MAG: helix-turn-helix transcriptional regulator [Clostridiales bacterium]|nr:helix-turn-helix transcriptional regulator [Clostridiales bacterium]
MLGMRLRQLRERRGLLQKDIAKLLGISTSAYGYYEQGKRDPNTESLIELAKFFNVSVDYLLGHADTPSIDRYGVRVEAMIQEFIEKLEMTEKLTVNDETASSDAIQSIIDSLLIGMKIAKLRNGSKGSSHELVYKL